MCVYVRLGQGRAACSIHLRLVTVPTVIQVIPKLNQCAHTPGRVQAVS